MYYTTIVYVYLRASFKIKSRTRKETSHNWILYICATCSTLLCSQTFIRKRKFNLFNFLIIYRFLRFADSVWFPILDELCRSTPFTKNATLLWSTRYVVEQWRPFMLPLLLSFTFFNISSYSYLLYQNSLPSAKLSIFIY